MPKLAVTSRIWTGSHTTMIDADAGNLLHLVGRQHHVGSHQAGDNGCGFAVGVVCEWRIAGHQVLQGLPLVVRRLQTKDTQQQMKS